MGTTREQAVSALLALFQSTGVFKTIGRRNHSTEQLYALPQPAVMLLGEKEEYKIPSWNMPPVRHLTVRAMVTYDTGQDENAIPDAQLNACLDAVDAALVPDQTGYCTLGGLVHAVFIEGEVIKAPGDTTGKALAAVPITIVLP